MRGKFFSRLFLGAMTLALGTLLAACAATPRTTGTTGVDTTSIWPESSIPAQQAPTTQTIANTGNLREPVRAAILVPQTGPNAALGEALVQAAQMAVFDLNEQNFTLVAKDTGGTPEGTIAAVNAAASEGAKIILGPLFAQEVAAAKTQARAQGLNVLGFSTDWRQAGDNVYSMGVLPFGQAQLMAQYAAKQGLRRIGILAPTGMYGDAVLSVFQTTAARQGVGIVKVVRLSPDGRDAAAALDQLTAGGVVYDAIFMPVGGQAIHILASSLKARGLDSTHVRYLGTGLWDDPSVLSDVNMSGAVYAAPSPQTRASFEANYKRLYGQTPPRLASIGYDATALAIVLARAGSFERAALTNPNGFSGVDGIFRFNQNGLAERGMAVLQIAGGTPRVVEAAPTSFLQMNQ